MNCGRKKEKRKLLRGLVTSDDEDCHQKQQELRDSRNETIEEEPWSNSKRMFEKNEFLESRPDVSTGGGRERLPVSPLEDRFEVTSREEEFELDWNEETVESVDYRLLTYVNFVTQEGISKRLD